MIKSLYIQNYALIHKLEMAPSPNLNIITGETGAGKSIMLGAIGLLLGNRADTKVLFDEEKKCIIEGVFDLSNYKLKGLFQEEELDYEVECVIRREINASGKSRAFVNDSPTTLPTLRTLGARLMDIHSQHESLQLGQQKYQLDVLDAFSSHSSLLEDYKKSYHHFTKASKKLKELERSASESAEDRDYKEFLLEELIKANLDDLNQEELEEELNKLENAEDIKLKLSQCANMLDESEMAIIQQLKEVLGQLSSIRDFSKSLDEVSNRIESTHIELSDVLNEIQLIQDHTSHDPERIQTINEKLDLLYRLQKKHDVLAVNDLIKIRDEIAFSLSKTQDLESQISEAKEELNTAKKSMLEAGQKLTDSRKLYAVNFADEIEKLIRKIGISNGQIEITITSKEPSSDGLDQVEILFSGNKGVRPQPLKDVASGGEFSRLIFSVKYLIADKTALPTIIFDEIDTGVSGEVALQMMKMMQQMAKNHQVISISHLPQFAAGGDFHYFVYKDHESDRTISKVKKLEMNERIEHIATMIGGLQPGEAAIQSARQLLGL